MLGWEVFVYRHGEKSDENLIARWKSSVFGVDWIDKLVAEGRAHDLGGNGYPCIYKARASFFIPIINPGIGIKRKGFTAVPQGEYSIFPRDYYGIVWNHENLRQCKPEEELLIYAYDQS